LAGIIHSGQAIGKCHQNFEFGNPRCPLAAIMKKLIAMAYIASVILKQQILM
jgi:hypothetical protein